MREVVITGIGLVTPIGFENDEFFSALCDGRSGVGVLEELENTSLTSRIGARVGDFQPKKHVKPRKNIKVMSRDIQMGFVAADKAWSDADVTEGTIDPERLGVIFGADLIAVDLKELEPAYRACMALDKFDYPEWGTKITDEMFPLWMLKYLPNMPACHIAIGSDARGPNDSVTVEGTSGLTALCEAVRVIQRGQAGRHDHRLHQFANPSPGLGQGGKPTTSPPASTTQKEPADLSTPTVTAPCTAKAPVPSSSKNGPTRKPGALASSPRSAASPPHS